MTTDKTDAAHRNTVEQMVRPGRSWHDVVRECERILGCPDTAESPTMSNLPNLVRDLKNGMGPNTPITGAERPVDGAVGEEVDGG